MLPRHTCGHNSNELLIKIQTVYSYIYLASEGMFDGKACKPLSLQSTLPGEQSHAPVGPHAWISETKKTLPVTITS